ncbi:MAG: DUF2306 domain-containing protein [Pseudomonadota bacterium]|nr:DUF2306 domain-containing protein [Pseudomonadota bacterium]
MNSGDASHGNWRLPAGLMVLSAVPVAAGVHRLIELAAGAAARPDNARFVAMPLPISLHVVCAIFFSVFGALQFAGGLRLRYPDLHRVLGRGLVPCGMAVALSGLWMTQFYPAIRFDGTALYVVRLLAGTAMAACLCLGVAAIRRRDIGRHRAWMMRAYALGLGAGTQVFTHIPWFLFPGMQGELARTLCMSAGWSINLAVAEWAIRAGRPQLRHG